MLQDYLPSKNFRVIIISLIGVVIIGYGISKIVSRAQTANKQVDLVVLSQDAQKDSDGDGAPDWQENLWGTSPTQKNSNPSGIGDAEYIAAQKAKAGDTNAFSASVIGSTNDNETEAFARQFFITIITLSQAGNLNDQTMQTLSDSFFQHIKDFPGEKPFYTVDGVKKVPTTYQNQVTYLKGIDAAMTKNKIAHDDTLLNIGLALTHNSTDTLVPVEDTAKKYEAIEQGIAALTVPENAVTVHLALINEYHALVYNIRLGEEVLTDPIKSVAGVLRYQDHIGKLGVALSNLGDYIKTIKK